LNFAFRDRFTQFMRSMFLQGSWNFPRMQGLGFFYSLLPWLEKISGDNFRKACYRHLGYFNTNPYMAPYILGVVSRLEEDGKNEKSVKARNNLMGPLGAIGDRYYWSRLLPFTVLLGLAFSFFWRSAAPFIFLLLFNAVHLKNRWSYLNLGYLNADSPLEKAASLNGRTLTKNLERATGPLMGFILGVGAFGTDTPGTVLIVFGAALLLFRRQWRTPAVFGLLVALGIALGLLGIDMRIPWSK